MTEIINLDIIKYSAFIMGMLTTLYFVIWGIKLNKKNILIILWGFIIALVWIRWKLAEINVLLFIIFWIWGILVVSSVAYHKKKKLDISKSNIIILLIIVISMPLAYDWNNIKLIVAMGILLFFYLYFISFLTGLNKSQKKWILFLYIHSWLTILGLCLVLAWDSLGVGNISIIENSTSIGNIVNILNQNGNTLLSFLGKWLIISYFITVVSQIIWISFKSILKLILNSKSEKATKQVIKKSIIGNFLDWKKEKKEVIIENYERHSPNQIKFVYLIVFIILILAFNYKFDIIEYYTLISLLLFTNMYMLNNFLEKS